MLAFSSLAWYIRVDMAGLHRLGDIAEARFGIHGQPVDRGDFAYIQVKHFNSYIEIAGKIDSWLKADGKVEYHFLQEGDILFTGKGYRSFAWTYAEEVGPAVASSIFYVIRPYPEVVIPEFLTLYLNMPQAQQHFAALGAGSSIPSIRKSELESISVPVPSLHEQHRLVKLSSLHNEDMRILRRITDLKQQLFNEVFQKLIK